MLQDFVSTALGSQALEFILVEQFLNEVLGVFRNKDLVLDWVREVDVSRLDQVVHLVLVPVEEWRDTHDHLVDQDAQRPPVYSVVVPIADQHLGG